MLYDLIIIGAAPAGISAAVYAARKGLNFLIVSKDVGGQVMKTSVVENYAGYQEITGPELSAKFQEHFDEFNFDFQQQEVLKIENKQKFFSVITQEKEYQSRTLILATGAHPRYLNIPGEEKLRAKGVTYCTTCDGPLFRRKDVAIVGGGNSALESALQLATIANQVFLLNLTQQFSGDEILIEKVEKLKNVKILFNAKTIEILGEKFVEGIKYEQDKKIKELKVQGVFINVGYLPESGLLKDLVALDKWGQIIVDKQNATSLEGVFAAGDCTDAPHKQIIIAAGSGANAAISVFDYLSRKK